MNFTELKTFRKLIFIGCIFLCLSTLAFFIFRSSYYRQVDVVIDAGHGGDDYGATYNGRNEKDDNLALALLVAQELDEKGITYKLTRNSDVFISLEKRCIIANERNARLFVALHRNSAENAKGVEIWINSEAPEEDKMLAENIMTALSAEQISLNRGVKTGYAGGSSKNYFVNSHTEMPSCLVELGFITDETDNGLYDENLESYALAIANGIEKSISDIYG